MLSGACEVLVSVNSPHDFLSLSLNFLMPTGMEVCDLIASRRDAGQI
jgi:hypothetical protein